MYEKYCIRLILPACVPFDTSFRKRKENDNNLQQWMLIGWRLKANIVWTYMHYVSQTPSYPSLEYVMHEGVALLPHPPSPSHHPTYLSPRCPPPAPSHPAWASGQTRGWISVWRAALRSQSKCPSQCSHRFHCWRLSEKSERETRVRHRTW